MGFQMATENRLFDLLDELKGKRLGVYVNDDHKFVMELEADAEGGRWFHFWIKTEPTQQED